MHLTKTDDLQEFIDFSINSVIILFSSIQLFLYFWIQTSWQWLIQNVCHYEAVILRSYDSTMLWGHQEGMTANITVDQCTATIETHSQRW